MGRGGGRYIYKYVFIEREIRREGGGGREKGSREATGSVGGGSSGGRAVAVRKERSRKGWRERGAVLWVQVHVLWALGCPGEERTLLVRG